MGTHPMQRGYSRCYGALALLFTGAAALLSGLFGVASASAQTPPYSVTYACPGAAGSVSGLHTLTYTNNTASTATFTALFVLGASTQSRLVSVPPGSKPVTYGTGSLNEFPEGYAVIVTVGGQPVSGGDFTITCPVPPPYVATLTCPDGALNDEYSIAFDNNTDATATGTVTFVAPNGATQVRSAGTVDAHNSSGSNYGVGAPNGTGFPEDNSVSVSFNGQSATLKFKSQTASSGSIVFNCTADVPPTTTTTVPPTTTTTVPVTTTTTAPAVTTTTAPAVTTTTTALVRTTNLTTTTTAVIGVRTSQGTPIVRGASTTRTLPRTGSDQRGLVLVGLVLTMLGTAIVVATRRRVRR